MTPEDAAKWKDLEGRGLVELLVEVDESPYDDSYLDEQGSPEHDEDAIESGSDHITMGGRTFRWTWSKDCSCAKCKRAQLWRKIERVGVWGIMGAFRTAVGKPWDTADSVWGFIGDEWNGSGYDDDVKLATMQALDEAFQAEADELAERATYAAG